MEQEDSPPASKADLAAVETRLKSDLTAVETGLKSDIQRLDTKIDGVDRRLDAKIDGVIVELVKTQGRMDAMEQRLLTRMDAGFDRVTGTIDAFVAKLETYGRETTLIPNALDEHGKTLQDHERRLVKLERP